MGSVKIKWNEKCIDKVWYLMKGSICETDQKIINKNKNRHQHYDRRTTSSVTGVRF